MKRYWPLIGAAGVAATLGLYVYVSRDPLYEEPETEEFLEEEIEYQAEVPEEAETSAPYTTKDTEKGKIKSKRKQTSQNHKRKESKPVDQSSGLEETVEEDEEYPSYYIPPEERENLTLEEVGRYIYEAREANDFKVALSYIKDLQKITESRRIAAGSTNREAVTAVGNGTAYGIVFDYDKYLSEVIKDCKKHDYNSVYSKVMFMNIFFANHPNPEIFTNDRYVEKLDLKNLIYKGELALGAVEDCR